MWFPFWLEAHFEVDGFAWSRRAMPRADGTATTQTRREKVLDAPVVKHSERILGFDGLWNTSPGKEGNRNHSLTFEKSFFNSKL